jgi:hypothetical protein
LAVEKSNSIGTYNRLYRQIEHLEYKLYLQFGVVSDSFSEELSVAASQFPIDSFRLSETLLCGSVYTMSDSTVSCDVELAAVNRILLVVGRDTKQLLAGYGHSADLPYYQLLLHPCICA